MNLEKWREELVRLERLHQAATAGYPQEANSTYWTEQAECQRHGVFTRYHRKMDLIRTFETKTDCPHCLAEKIAELREKIEQEQARKGAVLIQNLQKNSGISARFMGVSFENYQVTEQNRKAMTICQRYADKWLDRKAKGGGLVLCGKPGTGKNHLACAIAHQVINQHQDEVFLTTAMRIIRKVKSTWERKAELSESEALQFYCEKDLLIIDEIGVQFGTESELIILFEIINERYEQMRPTILISNLNESELAKYIGERVIDRMREGQGAVINFDWESYRK